jgi:hypothetical protein
MSQGHRHKDVDDAGHAPRAAAGHPEPGKQTLTARATKDASPSAEIERLKQEVHDAYIGDGEFDDRGILDHKIAATGVIAAQLGNRDENVGPDLLKTALSIGAAAAAGALVATGFGSGIVAGALIAGGSAAATSLPDHVDPDKGPTLDPFEFCETYEIALREEWPASVNKLLGRMNTLADARETHREVLAMRDRVNEVRQNQKNEILDAWVNALKKETQKGTESPGDMGTENFNDSTAGRLHIEGIKIDGRHEDGTTVRLDGLKAKLTDVPSAAKKLILDRKIGDINVSRTIEGTGVDPVAGISDPRTLPHFAFGVKPQKTKDRAGHQFHILVYTQDHQPVETNAPAQHQLRRIDGAASWQDGLTRIWDMIKGKTLKSLGVTSVGN